MTGLDKILSQIADEAQAAAKAKLAAAQQRAAQLMQAAQAEATLQCAQLAQRSAAEVADTNARAASAAALQKRRAVLTEKQRLIAATIEKARDSLYHLPQEQYFEVILKMAVKFALPQEGELLFSAKDLARLPADFDAALRAELAPKGAVLTVSRSTRPIDGGFVLAYGGIEENCSFAALFDAARDTLQDQVHNLLFS